MEHCGKLVILADMGELKVYNAQRCAQTDRCRLDLMTAKDYIEGRKKHGETVSDDQGRFGRFSGEDHGAEHESQMRLVRQIAIDISAVLEEAPPHSCYLAFPSRHHGQLMEALSDEARPALVKSIAADLVSLPVDDILSHFS